MVLQVIATRPWNYTALPYMYLHRLCTCSDVQSSFASWVSTWVHKQKLVSLPDHQLAKGRESREFQHNLILFGYVIGMQSADITQVNRKLTIGWHNGSRYIHAWIPATCTSLQPHNPGSKGKEEKRAWYPMCLISQGICIIFITITIDSYMYPIPQDKHSYWIAHEDQLPFKIWQSRGEFHQQPNGNFQV